MSEKFYNEKNRPAFAEYNVATPFVPAADVSNPLQMDATGALIVTTGGGGGGGTISPTVVANPVNGTPVTVSDTAGGTALVAASASRKTLALWNADSSDTVYIGPTGVTAANGFPMLPQTGYEWGVEDTSAQKAWYGITDTGLTAIVRVLTQA